MNFQKLFKTWDYEINNPDLIKISNVWVTDIYGTSNFWFNIQEYIQKNGKFDPIIPKNHDSLWSYLEAVKPEPIKLVEKLTKFEKVELIIVFHNSKNIKNQVMSLNVEEKHHKNFFKIEKFNIPENRVKKLNKLMNAFCMRKMEKILNVFYFNFLDGDTNEWVTVGGRSFLNSGDDKVLSIRVYVEKKYEDLMTEEELNRLKEKYEI